MILLRFYTWTLVLLLSTPFFLMGYGHTGVKIMFQDTSRKATLLKGEFKLKRLKASRIPLVIPVRGDTLWIHINSKEGLPFKKVGWIATGKKNIIQKPQPPTDIFDDKYQDSSSTKLELFIKAKLSLQRRIVQFSVEKKVLPVQPIRPTDSSAQIKSDFYKLSLWGLHPSGKWPYTQWRTVFKMGDEQHIENALLQIKRPPPQRDSLNPMGELLIPRSGKARAIPYRDFQKGDTLVFEVNSTNKALKAIWLTQGKDQLLSRVLHATTFTATVIVDTARLYQLHLKGYWSFKQQAVNVFVTRIRPVKPDSVYQISDSISIISKPIRYDTALLTVLDQELILPPVWDIERDPFVQTLVQIPQSLEGGFKFEKMAYWLGIGRETAERYLLLEASVPPDWSKPGAPVALGAYSLGRSIVLPENALPENKPPKSKLKEDELPDVISRFLPTAIQSHQYGRRRNIAPGFPHNKAADVLALEQLSTFSKLGNSSISKAPSYNFYACFQNRSTVNTYPIQLKVLGVYRKSSRLPEKVEFKTVKNFNIAYRK